MINRNEERAELREAAREMLPKLRDALEHPPEYGTALRVEELLLSRPFVEKAIAVLEPIAEGGRADCKWLYNSITLEMMANSNGWAGLRYHARRCL